MIDLSNHHLFTPFIHPDSGVTFHILTRKVAPVQKGFYFVNDSMSADGRFLWFCCAWPPALKKTLAVVDFQAGEVRHFPETQFTGESPYVDPGTGDVFWCEGPSVWRRGPHDDIPQCVNTLPSDLIGARGASRLATHLTRSADGREFFIDPHPRFVCNDQYVVFTTRVRGEIDVALVPTAELVGKTT